MAWPEIVAAVSAAVGATSVVLVGARRWFTSQVQRMIDHSMQVMLTRQAEFEGRINAHLKRQDVNINKIYRRVL